MSKLRGAQPWSLVYVKPVFKIATHHKINSTAKDGCIFLPVSMSLSNKHATNELWMPRPYSWTPGWHWMRSSSMGFNASRVHQTWTLYKALIKSWRHGGWASNSLSHSMFLVVGIRDINSPPEMNLYYVLIDSSYQRGQSEVGGGSSAAVHRTLRSKDISIPCFRQTIICKQSSFDLVSCC